MTSFLMLQKRIEKDFRYLYEYKPSAAQVLDEYIRCKVMGREAQANKIADRLSESNLFVGLLFSIYRFFLVAPRIKKRSIYCSVPRSPDLLAAVKLWGKENGYRIIEEDRAKSLRCLISLFFKKKVMIRRSFIFGRGFKRCLRNFFEDIDSDSFCESSLGVIDFCAFDQKLWYKRFLVNNNVKILILDNDQSAELQLLVGAAKSLNVRVFVFAHGYIQDPCFVSVFPLHADKLCVWSDGQKSLALESGAVEQEVVVNFGYPNYDPGKFKVGRRDFHKVLFVLEPLDPKDTFAFSIYNLAASKLQGMGFQVCVRLHPKQKDNNGILSKFSTEMKNVSDVALDSCLAEASLIIAGNSSLLFEAPVLGVPAIQLRELKKFCFENAVDINVDSINEVFVKGLIAKFEENYEFRSDSIYQRLCALLS